MQKIALDHYANLEDDVSSAQLGNSIKTKQIR